MLHSIFFGSKNSARRIHQAAEAVSTIDDYISGNDLLHDRFSLTMAIAGGIVSSAPNPVTIDQLVKFTGRPASELEVLCERLSSTGMLRSDA